MRLSDLFEIKNGIASSNVIISDFKTEDYTIPYFRPSSSWNNLVAGYIDKTEIDNKHIYPMNTLFVSTDGEGSHTYSYVSPFDFIPNSNVAVLIPKRKMELPEKMFYAMIITKNRFRFSYGRKPKGERLASLEIPEKVFNWVKKIEFTNYEKGIAEKENNQNIRLTNTENWKWFRYDQLFSIERGRGPRKQDLKAGLVPFVSSSDQENGVTGFTDTEPIHKGNVITVTRNGSVAEAFYQPIPFCSTEDVHIFNPKFEMSIYVAFFMIPLIRKEKYRYSYGRKWGILRMNESLIKLPVTQDGQPDFAFMENYIKTIQYSKQLDN
jgi:hypothetical protein